MKVNHTAAGQKAAALPLLLEQHRLILMEAAINERLRRNPAIQLHPQLGNAPLIYKSAGRAALRGIYQEYLDLAADAGLPILLCTPTWRADHDRVSGANVPATVNIDAASFMLGLREEQAEPRKVLIGGLIGCRNDCYTPAEGLSTSEAASYHAWQIEQLVKGGVDFLIVETVPSTTEAMGIAQAMAATGIPYFISFVIGRDGRILDGTPLSQAIARIDAATGPTPTGYMVNCAYPGFLRAAEQPDQLYRRLIGYLANASSLDHCELDQAEHLHAEPVAAWGELMLELNRAHGMRILGGCCGTDAGHLRYLVEGLVAGGKALPVLD